MWNSQLNLFDAASAGATYGQMKGFFTKKGESQNIFVRFIMAFEEIKMAVKEPFQIKFKLV